CARMLNVTCRSEEAKVYERPEAEPDVGGQPVLRRRHVCAPPPVIREMIGDLPR
ncbi:hypothetical protein QR685DRAFT_451801, partial [Neurospora intermedia]